MTAKRKFNSHITISTTTTETKRVKIDGSEGKAEAGRGIHQVGRAVVERLRPYEEAIRTGDVDVHVGISIDGNSKPSIGLDLRTYTASVITRHLHAFLRTLRAAHMVRLNHDYYAADRKVMDGRASATLYAETMERHLEALALFRAHGALGTKFACSFMMQIALRLVGVEAAPGAGVNVEGGSPDGDETEEAKRGGWGAEKLYKLFDDHMISLFMERYMKGEGNRRWVGVYAVNLKAMSKRAEEQGLGKWYFSRSISFLEEVEGRWRDGGKLACGKEDVGSLDEWGDGESEEDEDGEDGEDEDGKSEEDEDEESEGDDGRKPEKEENGKDAVVKRGSMSRSRSTELMSKSSSVEPEWRAKVEGRRDSDDGSDDSDGLFC